MEPTRITLVPHTHWDREWYRTFEEFRERLVAMMDTLIDLGDRGFPHFHLDGQTAVIDDYLAVRPERERDVKRLAAEGKLSVGPWVTQMDEFLTSGESNIRNLEMGLARAAELGTPVMAGYLPDQFGHIGQMPQILRMFGIHRAAVWRGVPRAVDKNVFLWESPDGSAVTTEYLAFGYALGGELHRAQSPGDMCTRLRRAVELLEPYAARDRYLIMVGSDHSGPHAPLPQLLAGANSRDPGLDARVGSLGDHLVGRLTVDLPVWRGELRSSARAHLLPNVYSTRAPQKRERGRVEVLVERYAEPLAALVPGFPWPEDPLERAWTLLLWNGAHDSACGCSVDGVARAVDSRFAEARSLAETIIEDAMATLGSNVRSAGRVRFNPSPFKRDGVPGLGWRVDPDRQDPAGRPVRPAVSEGWIEVEGVRLTLLDEPDVGDLYNYCYAAEGQRPAAPDWRVAGPEAEAVFGDDLRVRVRFSRLGDEPFTRIEVSIDNRRPDHRLRLHVLLPEEAAGSIAGSPFELVERPPVGEGGDVEAASPTWPARGVVMAGAVAVLTEGVVEYELVRGRELAITLLRCVGTISRPKLATRPWDAGPDIATPEAQVIGITEFSLAVLPDARRALLLPMWERFALPIRSATASGGGSLPEWGSLLEIEGAELSGLRKRGGELEVRVWNAAAEPAAVRVGKRRAVLRGAEIATVTP